MDLTEMTKTQLEELLETNRKILRDPDTAFMVRHLTEGYIDLIKERLRFMEAFDD